ncbi:hypothetical protein BS78_07G231100 [Paspalum vaginatum]|nr:hypothetical protein BS78_07G231100 [Paspalum vaginatum]
MQEPCDRTAAPCISSPRQPTNIGTTRPALRSPPWLWEDRSCLLDLLLARAAATYKLRR